MNVLEEYALLKAKLKDIQDKIKEKEADVRVLVFDSEDHKIQEDYGTFFIKQAPTYEYSLKIQEAEKKIDAMKEKEKTNGKAKKTVKETLVFMPARMIMPRGAYNFPPIKNL